MIAIIHDGLLSARHSLPDVLPDAAADQHGQDVADGGFAAGGLGQREVRLDLVPPVAAAVLVLEDVAGGGLVGDDPWALRSVMPRLAATSRSRTPGLSAMHSSTRAWLVRDFRLSTPKNLFFILAIDC
jgi:hypothetical protein